MNTKHIYKISNYLFLCMLVLATFACKDDDNSEDTGALALVSSNIAEGATLEENSGYVELTFNKKVRQAPNTSITFNGADIRIIILNNVVRYKYSTSDNTDCTFKIPSGALLDYNGNPYEGLTLNFKIMEEEVTPKLFDAIVDPNGNGNYTSIQAAIDAVPSNRTEPYLIFVAKGTYQEFVNVPKIKPFIHLIGQDKETTIITRTLTSASNASGDGGEEAWQYSWRNEANQSERFQEAVTMIYATDFYAENISFENKWGIEKLIGPMAEAMYTANDRIAFNNCKFRSFQDTWQTKVQSSADNGVNARQYATNCWIEGAVDYFYGNGNVLIENTTLYNVRYGSVITAANHTAETKWGYVFNNCTVDGINKVDPDKYGTASLDYIAGKGVAQTLGRPWQNSPITLFLNTKLKFDIDPAGWRDMGAVPALYAEYNTTDKKGKAVDMSKRKTQYLVDNVSYDYKGKTELSYSEYIRYTYENIINGADGWNPKKFMEKLEAPENVLLSNTTLSWDARYKAICYLIFKEDGTYVGQTTDTSIEVSDTNTGYIVKAANKYGTLSE